MPLYFLSSVVLQLHALEMVHQETEINVLHKLIFLNDTESHFYINKCHKNDKKYLVYLVFEINLKFSHFWGIKDFKFAKH